MDLKIKLAIAIALLINWMSVIYYLSSQVAEVSSVPSKGMAISLTDLLGIEVASEETLLFYEGIIRETAHGVEYCILGILAYFSLKYISMLVNKDVFSRHWFIEKAVVIFCFLYALSDEIHQLFVPGRAFEIMDLSIDLAGIVVGVLISRLLFYIKNKKDITEDK